MPERICSVDGCCSRVRARGLCSTHYNQQHQPNRHRKITVPCGQCGKPTLKHIVSRYAERFCSLACRDARRVSEAVERKAQCAREAADRMLPVLFVGQVVRLNPPRPEHPRSTRRWVAGNCHHCGKAYVAEDYTNTARYCSSSCLKQANRHRYRARKHEAYIADVSPRAIYIRDGWRCQLCRKPLRRDQVVPAPLAPVIDHVVPLARGGTHEPANVQSAHFICNSVKGHRMQLATQLALM